MIVKYLHTNYTVENCMTFNWFLIRKVIGKFQISNRLKDFSTNILIFLAKK
jgi:hypothetical protein